MAPRCDIIPFDRWPGHLRLLSSRPNKSQRWATRVGVRFLPFASFRGKRTISSLSGRSGYGAA